MTAIHTQDFVSFKRTIDDYAPLKTDLDVTINTIKLNLKYIENSINYTYSNGPIEGTIRKIKQIKRTGYGHRNMLSLFTRIRLELPKIKSSEPKVRNLNIFITPIDGQPSKEVPRLCHNLDTSYFKLLNRQPLFCININILTASLHIIITTF